MAKITDLRGNLLHEGDKVVIQISDRQFLGTVAKLTPILANGPYSGGTHVQIEVLVDFPVPPGHSEVPVFLTVDPTQRESLVVSQA